MLLDLPGAGDNCLNVCSPTWAGVLFEGERCGFTQVEQRGHEGGLATLGPCTGWLPLIGKHRLLSQ